MRIRLLCDTEQLAAYRMYCDRLSNGFIEKFQRSESQRVVYVPFNISLSSFGQGLDTDDSPFDKLERSLIEDQKIAREIPELVAVVGGAGGIHANACKCVAVSPDNSLVASGSRDGTAQIRDILTLEPVRIFKHSDDVDKLCFSADGKVLIVACWDGVIRAWPVEGDGLDKPKWEKRIGTVSTEVCFSPDRKKLISFAKTGKGLAITVMKLDESGSIIETTNLDPLEMFQDPDDDAISNDGRWLAANESSSGKLVYIWDLHGKETKPKWEIESKTHRRYNSVCFDPNANFLVCGQYESSIEIWKLHEDRAPTLEHQFECHKDNVSSLKFDPKGENLFSGGYDGEVYCHPWPIKPEQQSTRLTPPHAGWIGELAFSSDGEILYSASWDHSIRRWTKSAGQWMTEKRLGHTQDVTAIAFSSDGKQMATGSTCEIGSDVPNEVLLWNLGGKSVRDNSQKFACTGRVNAIEFSHDSLFMAIGDDNGISIFDANSGKLIETVKNIVNEYGVKHHDRAKSIVARKGIFQFASGWIEPSVKMHRFENGMFKEIASGEAPGHHVKPLDLSFDEKFLVAGSENGNAISLLDADTLISTAEFQVKNATRVEDLDCSPAENVVAIASRNSNVVLVDFLNTPRSETVLKGHTSVIESVSFNKDGTYLASGDWDGNAIVWNVKTQEKVAKWTFPGRIWKLRFAPDGRHLVVGDGTGRLYVLRLTNSK